ncbi:MAG: hypothetical protein QM756_06105 [Polyangiaceae bacterium]
MQSRIRAALARAKLGISRRLEVLRARFRTDRRWLLLEVAAIALLAVSLFAFLRAWLGLYSSALFDPNLQTDDARTALFAFHRYGPGSPLKDDPIANEMIQYQPHAFRLIYFITVPFVGLLWAAKVAQIVCLLIVVVAAIVLARSRRAGLGAGALLLFLFFRDGFMMDRVGGGLPRSFGFPAMALWLAGALGHSLRARRAGAIVAALTYPSALAMVLGAEGLYTLRRFGRPGFRTTWRRVRHYLLLVAACAALFAPAALLASGGGPVHTLEQAQAEPAFGKSGRLWLLPLPETGSAFGKQFFASLKPAGESPWPAIQDKLYQYRGESAAIFAMLMLAIPLLGFSPAPAALVAFFASSLAMYALSVLFAFRLYSPERYYSYGMHFSVLTMICSSLGLLAPRLRERYRSPLRNVAAALSIFFLWSWLGVGAGGHTPMAMTIDYRRRQSLWEFIEKLPPDTRVASFITDGDDIPLFAKRANNGGFETLQPWLTQSWARQKARAEDTLTAFYSTDQAEVLAYAEKYKVTHLLVNRARYGGQFVKRAMSFEPLSSFARNLLNGRSPEQCVLEHVPPEAIVFEFDPTQIVSVEKLKQAWAEGH